MKRWFLAPAVPGEAAVVALFSIAAILLIAGVFWQKDLAAVLVIAAVIGGCTRLAGFRVATRPRN
jgi:hypothetical protein